jgi:osmoprotectant transport system substrate-binding protein
VSKRAVRTAVLVLLVVAAAALAACSPEPPEMDLARADDEAVAVASFDFPESVLLAEIYAQALAAAGIPVRRELNLGPREVVDPALASGLVDAVPEYVGTALATATGEQDVPADPAEAQRRLRTIDAGRGLRVLEAAPAQSQNGLVVTQLTALTYSLGSVSDLAAVAGTLVFGGPPECERRPYCLPGLESVYGLVFERVVPLDSGGPLTVAALRAGEIDVALLFTSDAHLGGGDLVLLQDDKALQPAENIVPVVRQAVVERYGAVLTERLDLVSAALSTGDLVALNAEIGLRERAPGDVAAEWLAAEGIGPG